MPSPKALQNLFWTERQLHFQVILFYFLIIYSKKRITITIKTIDIYSIIDWFFFDKFCKWYKRFFPESWEAKIIGTYVNPGHSDFLFLLLHLLFDMLFQEYFQIFCHWVIHHYGVVRHLIFQYKAANFSFRKKSVRYDISICIWNFI